MKTLLTLAIILIIIFVGLSFRWDDKTNILEDVGVGIRQLYIWITSEPSPDKLAESLGRSNSEKEGASSGDSFVSDSVSNPTLALTTSVDQEMLDWGLMEKINYIKERAEKYGVDPNLARRIAECESYDPMFNTCHCVSGNPFQNNCIEDCRQGIGIFKITQTTFDEQCEGNPKDIKDNIDCGIKMMSKDQYSRWNQSKHCWSKSL